MEIISLFAGERRRSIDVTSLDEIETASRELPIGDGWWGQRVEGTVEELREVATESRDGAWTIRTLAGWICAEVRA